MGGDDGMQGGKEGRERWVEKVGCYLNLFLHLQSPCGDADRKLAALWPVAGACFHQDAGMKTHHQPGTSCSTEVVDRLVDIFVHLFLHTHTAATQRPRGIEGTGRSCEASCRCDSREHRGGTSGEDTCSTLEYHLQVQGTEPVFTITA